MFKVIDGGLSETSSDSRKKFISAYITNTRLMGVVGIVVHWKLTDNETNTELYQCFYLDAEEYGFDSYECVVGPDNDETEDRAFAMSERLLGGLGGSRVKISENEMRSLVQDYVFMNTKKGIEIPEEAEIDFIMKPEAKLSVKERRELMVKQCEEITGDYQLVNYFIMRCVGHDFEAARYLTSGHIDLRDFRDDEPAALIRNSSELTGSDFNAGKKDSFRTAWTYRTTSLVEYKGYFEVITSRVTVEDLKVIGFEVIDRERITSREADMMTRREEYVILNELEVEPEYFTKASCAYTRRSQETAYDTGRLFVIFNPDNRHVTERVYKLNDDVFGSVYVNDFGQLIVSSFVREKAEEIERSILRDMGVDAVYPLVRYNFDMPVLYEYIKSGFDDFEDFIDLISDSDPV